MNKLKLILVSLILIVCAWIRFVRERKVIEIPKDINSITIYIYTGIFILIAISLVFHLYSIYILYFGSKNEFSKNKYFSFAKIKVYITNKIKIINSYLIQLDILIKNNVPKYNHHKTWLDVYFEYICNKLQKNHDIKIKLILFLYFLIKIVVCGLFVLDVIFFNKIYYFYKAIILLFIPLFIEYCVYSINTSIQVNLNSLDEILNIFIKNNNNNETMQISIYDLKEYIFNDNYSCYYYLKEEYVIQKQLSITDQKNTVEYILSYVNLTFSSKSCLDLFIEKKIKINLFFNVFKYLIYLICWGYIILKYFLIL